MNHLKVATRLFLLTGVLIVLMVAVGLLGLFGIAQANREMRSIYEDRTVPAVQLAELDQLGFRSRIELEAARDEHPGPALERRLAQVQAHGARADELWRAYMATYLTDEEKALAQAAAAARARFVGDGLAPVMAALRADRRDEAHRLLTAVLPGLGQAMDRTLDELTELQAREARKTYEASLVHHDQIRWLVFGAIGAAMAFAAGLGALIVRGLRAQLGAEPGEAAQVAQRVAAGDLATPVPLRPGDDGRSLMAQLAAMQGSLAQLVGQVRHTADGLAAASTQIAQGNADLSSRTEEQAAALQQTAASMEQLQSTVKHTADNARRADERARQASQVAQQGGQVVGQVVATMREIHGQSRRIADIIGTIDGIAFQTNILALNAAVEAARAGEQGRGFAVVASEVRTLAQRAAAAAREIKSLITASVERVQAGSGLVEDAGRTIDEVVQAVAGVGTLVSEISAAAVQQSSGVSQVNDAVGQMDQATQQNAALVEETAAAAESLRTQAQGLVQAVQAFVVGAEAKAAAAEGAAASPRQAAQALLQRAARRAEGPGAAAADAGWAAY